jgi:hypothetical protein
MGIDISVTQQKRVEKVERLRRYFTSDRREIYEWTPNVDESLDWESMTDEEVFKYLKARLTERLKTSNGNTGLGLLRLRASAKEE